MRHTRGIRFAQVKREGYFQFAGHVWKRIRGRFAVRVDMIGRGGYEVYFDLETIVGRV